VAALCLCCLGADKALVQNHVWSTYGDLQAAQGCKEWGKLIAGIGQGNGVGPQIWAAVSTPLFQILAEEGFLAKVICTISRHKWLIVGFGFINDTDLCITAVDNKLPSILHQMQQSLWMWADLLPVTRGTLVP